MMKKPLKVKGKPLDDSQFEQFNQVDDKELEKAVVASSKELQSYLVAIYEK